MPPDFGSGGSVISVSDAVGKGFHRTGRVPALGSTAGQFFNFFLSGPFGQVTRGRVAPGH